MKSYRISTYGYHTVPLSRPEDTARMSLKLGVVVDDLPCLLRQDSGENSVEIGAKE